MSARYPIPAAGELTPERALDDCGQNRLTGDAAIVHLLRWMRNPAAARGKDHYVPDGHPSGLGGRVIYVPSKFPLPDQAG